MEKGFTPEIQQHALKEIQRRWSMPIDLGRRPRMVATVHACRAVVAAQMHGSGEALLSRLRIRAMSGDLIDEPRMAAARLPSRSALALDHKLAPVPGGRRYTCPSYEIEGP